MSVRGRTGIEEVGGGEQRGWVRRGRGCWMGVVSMTEGAGVCQDREYLDYDYYDLGDDILCHILNLKL